MTEQTRQARNMWLQVVTAEIPTHVDRSLDRPAYRERAAKIRAISSHALWQIAVGAVLLAIVALAIAGVVR